MLALKELRKFAYRYFHTRTEERLEKFLRRYHKSPDYESVKEVYTEAFKNKERYNFDYLKSLVYIKGDNKKSSLTKSQRLPI